MDFRYSITADERERLYNEVWAEPVTTVAARYNLSDNGLRKHCRKYGIPLPPPGYWARVKSGQKVQMSALPQVTGELKKQIRNYVIKYRADFDQITDDELMSGEELNLLREETKMFIRDICSRVQVKGQLRNPHRLINEHKEETTYRRKRDKALKQASFNPRYYASVKSNYRENKAILPVSVTECNINRAYRIIDSIINTLDGMEAHTYVGQESGNDTGTFRVMRGYFRFEIKEQTTKKKGHDGHEEKPYLVLSLFPTSWFYRKNHPKMVYQDENNEPLESQVGKIIYDMFVIANKLQTMDELEERTQKRKEDEQNRQRLLEKMRAGELEEIKLLEQASSDWNRARRIRKFTDCMESKVGQLDDEQKKAKLLNWVKWARDKADWIDPLTDSNDELFGKSQSIFEVILSLDSKTS